MAPRWLCRLAVFVALVMTALVPSAPEASAPEASALEASAPVASVLGRPPVLDLSATAEAATAAATATALGEDDMNVSLVGDVPVTAVTAAAKGNGCTDWATGPHADMDLWRFALRDTAAQFVSVELSFLDERGRAVTRTVGSSPGTTAGIDGSVAWLATDAGWVLVAGTATVTGGTGVFELVRACPAATTQTPAPMVVGRAPAVGGLDTSAARPPGAQGAQTTPRALAAGTDISAMVTLGSTLVLAGVLLLVVRRRRPRGRHRPRRGRPPVDPLDDIRRPVIAAPR